MSLADALPVTLDLNPSRGGVTMPKGSLFAGTVLLSVVTAILATGSRADDKKTLTVTAVTHDARVNERTSYHTKPGQSTTDCTGTGTDSTIHVDCESTTTSPTTSSITTRTTDVNEKVIDSEGMVYTIACTDRPNILLGTIAAAAAGGKTSGGDTTISGRGKCIPLKDGDQFDAEIKETTMWVQARKGGNQGKQVKIKYKILDIRKLEPPVSDSNCKGDEQDSAEVWKLGRSLGVKDDLIADGIKTMGVCKALFYTRRAYSDKMGTSECLGDHWDTDRAMSLGRSLGGKENEIKDAIKQHGVCKVLSYLRQEQADKKAQSSDASLGVPAPDISQQAAVPLPTLPTESQPLAPVAAPSPASVTSKGAGQSATSDDRNPRIGGGHRIREISKNGAIITLEDGSLWEIDVGDRRRTAIWRPATNITVLRSESRVDEYKYTLINKDDGEKALAKYLGKE